MRERESLFNEYLLDVRKREKEEKLQRREQVSIIVSRYIAKSIILWCCLGMISFLVDFILIQNMRKCQESALLKFYINIFLELFLLLDRYIGANVPKILF